jgi:hypothetical protein
MGKPWWRTNGHYATVVASDGESMFKLAIDRR